ncbi:helix-turn-helix domain-containing protein [Sinobaca sp. H24]|uniref:BglG family transcription antiterminator n=1 Tax=Sinobaca sp. H24 TaxID=2923376 RepID=UPI00207A6A66|nr:helix-turn-helix domain-containing protein [Sinobaca sp. H24]
MDDRSKQILDELMHNPNVASVVLEKKYNLTRRQFGYSMNKINEWLMAKHLPVIERTRQGHFIIDQSVFTDLTSQENDLAAVSILSEKQRTYMIMLMLLGTKEELSLYHFTAELEVSKNTVLHDLKQVQVYLEKYELSIRYSRKSGYLLEGKEFQVRKLLIHVTYRIFQMADGEQKIKKAAHVDEKEIEEFRSRIEKVENKLHLKFTDEKLAMMPYILLFIYAECRRAETSKNPPFHTRSCRIQKNTRQRKKSSGRPKTFQGKNDYLLLFIC